MGQCFLISRVFKKGQGDGKGNYDEIQVTIELGIVGEEKLTVRDET